MKLSIAWIFNHLLDANWRRYDIPSLVAKFNTTTAEIEYLENINLPLESVFIGTILESIVNDYTKVFIPELQKEVLLPFRPDAAVAQLFLVFYEQNEFRWAIGTDCASSKDHYIPAVFLRDQSDSMGAWRTYVDADDYIVHVENKSITHRPDLWGHRGFAREIGSICNVPLVPIESLLASIPVVVDFAKNSENDFAGDIQASARCSRLAVCIDSVTYRPSFLPHALQLLRVDCRPLNFIVDSTNYVMYDLGHPMHAFDAEKLHGKKIQARLAKNGESIQLLDNQVITLEQDDLVIADQRGPIALAGIMGGRTSSITDSTQHVVFEAACFDAAGIRRTAARHKKRTDAAMRFEKSLDPQGAIVAIQRMIFLLQAIASADITSVITVVGQNVKSLCIVVSHDLIEKRLGVSLTPEFVINTLRSIEFQVECTESPPEYRVTVPSFRQSKDILSKEDIVEEIGRFYGFDAIPVQLPFVTSAYRDTTLLHTARHIKHSLAYGLNMRELQNYAFFDEHFLRQISFEPTNTVAVKQPVSENWYRLVTSLIPGLLSAVQQNCAQHDVLRFFEQNSTWSYRDQALHEATSIAGIFFTKDKTVDFYEGKRLLTMFFDALGIIIEWKKIETLVSPWFSVHQSAQLYCKDAYIGLAGMVDTFMLHKVAEGSAFIFELHHEPLVHNAQQLKQFSPLPKYPAVTRDMSLVVPVEVTAEQLRASILRVDPIVIFVEQIDVYEHLSLVGHRAFTLRITLRDQHATLTGERIDGVMDTIAHTMQKLGVRIR